MPLNIKVINKKSNSKYGLGILGLFIFLHTVLNSCASTKSKINTGKNQVEYAMTVAAIRPATADGQYIEVSFNESARFYRIPKNTDPVYLNLLKSSQENSTQVLVKRANEYSDIILRVKAK